MKEAYRIIDDVVVINVEKYFTSETSIKLRDYTEELFGDNIYVKGVILDFEFVAFVPLDLIDTIVDFFRQLRNSEYKIVACGLEKSVQTSFELTGLGKIIDIHDSVDSAINSFESPE